MRELGRSRQLSEEAKILIEKAKNGQEEILLIVTEQATFIRINGDNDIIPSQRPPVVNKCISRRQLCRS